MQELLVDLLAARAELVDQGMDVLVPGLGLAVLERGGGGAGEQQLEVVGGGDEVGVLLGDGLALLGDAKDQP